MVERIEQNRIQNDGNYCPCCRSLFRKFDGIMKCPEQTCYLYDVEFIIIQPEREDDR